jgi:hypothetical protein
MVNLTRTAEGYRGTFEIGLAGVPAVPSPPPGTQEPAPSETVEDGTSTATPTATEPTAVPSATPESAEIYLPAARADGISTTRPLPNVPSHSGSAHNFPGTSQPADFGTTG